MELPPAARQQLLQPVPEESIKAPLNHTLESLKEQLKKAPAPRIYLEISDRLNKEGKGLEALETLKEGIEKFPRNVPLLVTLGKIYFERKELDKCIEIFSQVLKLDRENTIAIKYLAMAYEEKKDYVEAIKKYKFLRVFFPQDEQLQKKIEDMEILANPPLSLKEKKLLKLNKFLDKIKKRKI
ncbi:MAG: tetratricopeptide repeat protein [Thermoanaerobaculia bacterium]